MNHRKKSIFILHWCYCFALGILLFFIFSVARLFFGGDVIQIINLVINWINFVLQWSSTTLVVFNKLS